MKLDDVTVGMRVVTVCAPHALKKRDGGGKVCGVCWKAAE